MSEEVKQTLYTNAEDDPFQATPKSSVKLKNTTRGLSWEIKVVTGEESLIDGLMLKAVEIHKKMKEEFKDEWS